jgi:hypothetical protein
MSSAVKFKRFAALSVLLAFAGLVGACTTINTGSHFDETTDFNAYKSFSWIDEEPLVQADSSMPVSALAQSTIKSEIQSQLEQKGYAFSTDRGQADFVIAYTIGTRQEIRIDSYPAHYRGDWGWHVPYSYYDYREISAHNYTKGTLGIDIFDNESGKPVWHGWVEKTVTESDRDDPRPAIAEGLGKLFEYFPK